MVGLPVRTFELDWVHEAWMQTVILFQPVVVDVSGSGRAAVEGCRSFTLIANVSRVRGPEHLQVFISSNNGHESIVTHGLAIPRPLGLDHDQQMCRMSGCTVQCRRRGRVYVFVYMSRRVTGYLSNPLNIECTLNAIDGPD